MSHPNQKDFKPLIIHGKSAQPKRDINLGNVHAKSDLHRTNSMNCSSIERKIDEGSVTVPKTIPLSVSNLFRNARLAIKNAEDKSLTQDAFAKHCSVPKVDTKFIQQLESGQLMLNHDNKMIVRKLQAKLKIPHFDLL
jgi:hypothetical protein